MTITLGPDLEAALTALSRERGIPPQALAIDALRAHFLSNGSPPEARDEWERQLVAAGSNCGVSLSHKAVSSEGLYE